MLTQYQKRVCNASTELSHLLRSLLSSWFQGCCSLTLSLPAVASYGGGGDGRDGDAADGGRHLHLEHFAPPRLIGSVVWQRVPHGVPQLEDDPYTDQYAV